MTSAQNPDVQQEVARRHAEACARSESLYSDPVSGWSVMTAYYLKKRGFCCGLGCRHCPWVGTAGEHPDREQNRLDRDARNKP